MVRRIPARGLHRAPPKGPHPVPLTCSAYPLRGAEKRLIGRKPAGWLCVVAKELKGGYEKRLYLFGGVKRSDLKLERSYSVTMPIALMTLMLLSLIFPAQSDISVG